MASSGRRGASAALLLGLVPALFAACGGGDAPDPEPATISTASGFAVDLSTAVEAREGEAIAVTPGAPALPPGARPVVAAGSLAIVAVDGGAAFALWDPATGGERALWSTPSGRQDIVTAATDSYAAFVRTGESLPFPDWELHLYDIARGQSRVVAKSDPKAAEDEALTPGLPLGFAPFATLSGNRLSWAEYAREGEASVRRIQLLEIDSGDVRTVASVDPALGALESPSLGGGRLAWFERGAGGQAFAVLDIARGVVTTHAVGGKPFQAALDADGRYLAWDDGLAAKYALDLESGDLTRYATEEGWGVVRSGGLFSWVPAGAYGGSGGYFDPATSTVRLLPASRANFAQPIGDWFTWQDFEAGVYRFASIES